MDVTEILVRFLFETKYEDLPPEVVGRAKLIILDALGCGLGGTTTDLARVTWAVTREVGVGGECTVIGTRDKTNCVQAAWANSVLVNALDMDNTGPVGHQGQRLFLQPWRWLSAIGLRGRNC